MMYILHINYDALSEKPYILSKEPYIQIQKLGYVWIMMYILRLRVWWISWVEILRACGPKIHKPNMEKMGCAKIKIYILRIHYDALP